MLSQKTVNLSSSATRGLISHRLLSSSSQRNPKSTDQHHSQQCLCNHHHHHISFQTLLQQHHQSSPSSINKGGLINKAISLIINSYKNTHSHRGYISTTSSAARSQTQKRHIERIQHHRVHTYDELKERDFKDEEEDDDEDELEDGRREIEDNVNRLEEEFILKELKMETKSNPILERYPSSIELNEFLSKTFGLNGKKLLEALKDDKQYSSPSLLYYINNWLQSIGSKDLDVYKYILESLNKEGRTNMMWKMGRALIKSYNYDIEILTIMLRLSLDNNNKLRSNYYLGLLTSYKQRTGKKYTIEVYIELLRVYSHNISRINRIEAEVAKDGLSKWGAFNAALIAVLINDHHNIGRASRIYEDEIQNAHDTNSKMEVCIHESLLIGYARLKRFDLYTQLWAEMERDGIEPTPKMVSMALLKMDSNQLGKFYKAITQKYPELAYDNDVLTALINSYISNTPDYESERMMNFFSYLFSEIIQMRESMPPEQRNESLFKLYNNVLGICLHRKEYSDWCMEEIFRLLAQEHAGAPVPPFLLSKMVYACTRSRSFNLLKKTLKTTIDSKCEPTWHVYGDIIQTLLLAKEYQSVMEVLLFIESYKKETIDPHFLADLYVFTCLRNQPIKRKEYRDRISSIESSYVFSRVLSRIIENFLLLDREKHAIQWFEDYVSKASIPNIFYLFLAHHTRKKNYNELTIWKQRMKDAGYHITFNNKTEKQFHLKSQLRYTVIKSKQQLKVKAKEKDTNKETGDKDSEDNNEEKGGVDQKPVNE